MLIHYGPISIYSRKHNRTLLHQPACGPYSGATTWPDARFSKEKDKVTCRKCNGMRITQL